MHDHHRTGLPPIVVVMLICVGAVSDVSSQTSTRTMRPRVIVTTDPELDDSNSLVRYLLYSADLQTEGIIYASSQFHWRGDGKGTVFSVPNREYSRGGLNLCPCTSWHGSRASATQYTDADTYPGTIVFSAADSLTTTFHVPQDATDGQTIHALLQVTDKGALPLTSFQRVIVTVKVQ